MTLSYQKAQSTLLAYCFAFLCCLAPFSASALKILLINPIPPNHAELPLWQLTTKLVQSAAKVLKVDLQVISGGSHRFKYLETLKSLKQSATDIDYIIFHPQQGITIRQFKALEKLKIPFVCLENNMGPKEILTIGKPGKEYKYWLGGVYFDDVQAGSILTNALIKENQNRQTDPVSLTAISGNHAALSKKREQGLLNSQLKAEHLNQIVRTHWNRDIAIKKVATLLKRYHKTNIIWVASDQIALALLSSEAIKNSAKKMIIGGLPNAISSIDNNGLVATAGGHFMQAAIALIKVFDHHHGINSFPIEDQYLHPFSLITKENVKFYLPLTKVPNWDEVDFTQYSQYLSANKSKPLNLENLLKSIKH